MNKLFNTLLLISIFISCQQSANPIEKIIQSDNFLKTIAEKPKHEVQVIYTQIDRDELQRPTFTTYTFQLDSTYYFYPASTVKLPAALLAMEMINHLQVAGFTKYSRMEIDSAHSRQIAVRIDSSAPIFEPTVAHYIRKILIASDNDAFNRLYEMMGQDYINETLRGKKYAQTRLLHRLAISRTKEENRYTNPMRFYHQGQLIYESPISYASGSFYPNDVIMRGKAQLDTTGLLKNQPFDFSEKNFFPLQEQHRMLQAVMFPEHFPSYAFDLTEDDYRFLYKNMATLPQESGIGIYDDSVAYWPSFVKFLLFGSDPKKTIPDHIRIFNKIGLAYGYTTDNAYIIDTKNGVEFLLSATILANENQTFNDGIYEYDVVALPFLGQLGQKVYELELDRPKTVKPDFTYLSSLF